MARTLYDELQDPISVQKEINEAREELDSLLILTADTGYSFRNGMDPSSQEILPEISVDVEKYQKQVLDDWTQKNETLKDAIRKKRSIEDTLKLAANSNRGIRRFTPRLKNEFINDKIGDIESLVGDLSCLEHNGIFYPDNPLATFVYASVLGASTYFLPIINLEDAVVNGIGTGFFTALLFSKRDSNSKLPWEKARYIDQRVRELYP